MTRLLGLPAAGLAVPLRPGRRLVGRTLGGAVGGLVDRARRWPEESQQVARRNAMLASTVLASRRAEREDVADFLRELTATRTRTAPTAAAAHA